MRLTFRAAIAIAWAMPIPACSSLGGVDLQDGAEGRFTAGDDGDPTDPDGGSHPPTPTSDGDEGTSDPQDDDTPLEPPHGTEGSEDGGSTGDTQASDGTDGRASDTDDGEGSTDEGSTSSAEPHPNGVDSNGNESASASTGDTGECTDGECWPPCDPTLDAEAADLCDQPCAETREGAACVTEGGIVLSCDMGVWTCAA